MSSDLPLFIVGTVTQIPPQDPTSEQARFFVATEHNPQEQLPVQASEPLATWLTQTKPQPGTRLMIRGYLRPQAPDAKRFYVQADRIALIDPRTIPKE